MVDKSQRRFTSLIRQIEARCTGANIECVLGENGFIFDNDLTVYFPSGRDKRRRYVFDIEDAETLLSIEFENLRYVEGYEAYYYIDTGIIHASVLCDSQFLGALSHSDAEHKSRTLERIFGQNLLNLDPFQVVVKQNPDDADSAEILLQPKSPTSTYLTRGVSGALEVIISNVKTHDHKGVLNCLESLSDSFFFQIEAETDTSFYLARTSKWRPRVSKAVSGEYLFPTTRYSRQAMVCYWYALSAKEMPLMQYIGFYQAIEFFFPWYSQQSATRAIRNVLKLPSFRTDNDEDIVKIISAVRLSRGSTGSEKSQLHETIKSCVLEDDIKSFLRSDSEKKDFFAKNKELKVQKISVESESADILREIADRIYQLRCKIVHTKMIDSESNDDPILPFTKEEALLDQDIQLIKFVATRVISASGTHLDLRF